MTDIYAVLIQDRHCDPEVVLFNDPVDALEFAEEELVKGSCNRPEEITYYNINLAAGDLLHATYSGEGDSVTVTKQQVR